MSKVIFRGIAGKIIPMRIASDVRVIDPITASKEYILSQKSLRKEYCSQVFKRFTKNGILSPDVYSVLRRAYGIVGKVRK